MGSMDDFLLTKNQAAKIFDERPNTLHRSFGVSRQAVNQWPDPLPFRRTNEVLGLALRLYGTGRLTAFGSQLIEQLQMVRTRGANEQQGDQLGVQPSAGDRASRESGPG